MNNNLKYTLQKNKGKLWLIGSILFLGVSGTGVYMVMNHDDNVGISQETSDDLATTVFNAKSDGSIQLLNIYDGAIVKSEKLPSGDYIYKSDDNYEKVYAYNGKSLMSIQMSKASYTVKNLVDVKVAKIDEMEVNGNLALLYSKKEKKIYEVSLTEGKVLHAYKVENDVIDMAIYKDKGYYITVNQINSLVNGKKITVELGETLTHLATTKNGLIVHSRFGNDKDTNILMGFKPNPKNKNYLDVESLKKMNVTDSYVVDSDDSDNETIVANEYTGNNGYVVMKKYKYTKNDFSVDKMLIQVPLTDEIHPTRINSLYHKDYLYVQMDDVLRVYDVKSKRLQDIKLKTDGDFVMPVLFNTNQIHKEEIKTVQ